VVDGATPRRVNIGDARASGRGKEEGKYKWANRRRSRSGSAGFRCGRDGLRVGARLVIKS
jgi:hypothetical protein